MALGDGYNFGGGGAGGAFPPLEPPAQPRKKRNVLGFDPNAIPPSGEGGVPIQPEQLSFNPTMPPGFGAQPESRRLFTPLDDAGGATNAPADWTAGAGSRQVVGGAGGSWDYDQPQKPPPPTGWGRLTPDALATSAADALWGREAPDVVGLAHPQRDIPKAEGLQARRGLGAIGAGIGTPSNFAGYRTPGPSQRGVVDPSVPPTAGTRLPSGMTEPNRNQPYPYTAEQGLEIDPSTGRPWPGHTQKNWDQPWVMPHYPHTPTGVPPVARPQGFGAVGAAMPTMSTTSSGGQPTDYPTVDPRWARLRPTAYNAPYIARAQIQGYTGLDPREQAQIGAQAAMTDEMYGRREQEARLRESSLRTQGMEQQLGVRQHLMQILQSLPPGFSITPEGQQYVQSLLQQLTALSGGAVPPGTSTASTGGGAGAGGTTTTSSGIPGDEGVGKAFAGGAAPGAAAITAGMLIPKLLPFAGPWGRAASIVGSAAAGLGTAYGMPHMFPSVATAEAQHPEATALGQLSTVLPALYQGIRGVFPGKTAAGTGAGGTGGAAGGAKTPAAAPAGGGAPGGTAPGVPTPGTAGGGTPPATGGTTGGAPGAGGGGGPPPPVGPGPGFRPVQGPPLPPVGPGPGAAMGGVGSAGAAMSGGGSPQTGAAQAAAAATQQPRQPPVITPGAVGGQPPVTMAGGPPQAPPGFGGAQMRQGTVTVNMPEGPRMMRLVGRGAGQNVIVRDINGQTFVVPENSVQELRNFGATGAGMVPQEQQQQQPGPWQLPPGPGDYNFTGPVFPRINTESIQEIPRNYRQPVQGPPLPFGAEESAVRYTGPYGAMDLPNSPVGTQPVNVVPASQATPAFAPVNPSYYNQTPPAGTHVYDPAPATTPINMSQSTFLSSYYGRDVTAVNQVGQPVASGRVVSMTGDEVTLQHPSGAITAVPIHDILRWETLRRFGSHNPYGVP